MAAFDDHPSGRQAPGAAGSALSRATAWISAVMFALALAGAPVSAQAQTQTQKQTQPEVRAESLGALSLALTQYQIDVWQTEQVLPLKIVQSLLQALDGTLWVGTAAGLARFDDVRCRALDAAEAPEPASQPIFCLIEDAQQKRQGRAELFGQARQFGVDLLARADAQR